MAGVANWVRHFQNVNGPSKTHGPAWNEAVAEMLIRNDCMDVADLEGLDVSTLDKTDGKGEKVPGVKLAALTRIMRRMDEDRETKRAAQDKNGLSNSLQDIAKVFGGPQEKVTHDLAANLPAINLSTVPPELWPKAEAVNFIATEAERQR